MFGGLDFYVFSSISFKVLISTLALNALGYLVIEKNKGLVLFPSHATSEVPVGRFKAQ